METRGSYMDVEGSSVQPQRVCSEERHAAANLPDVMDRIEDLKLTQEYAAFKARYHGWRKGSAHGARGELRSESIQENRLKNLDRGFGYWYRDADVWTWRRTLSYWIAVTFFEGSLFFIVSSFFFCYPTALGRYKQAVTTFGYLAGKVNFFVCTYLMCLETINLSARKDDEEEPNSESRRTPLTNNVFEDDERFYWWPFHIRTALENLEKLGAGPYPYYASALYFVGVNIYVVGLVAEFLSLPEAVVRWIGLITFLFGGLFFLLGGLAECAENRVFTTCRLSAGWIGALLNAIGGGLFLLGSLFNFFEGQEYWGSMSFAIGAIVYALGSGVMIIMWKDEQFGLTFLASLNDLGGPNGRPLVSRGGSRSVEEEATFSTRGAVFIMLYCFAATVSTYNFLTSMRDIGTSNLSWSYVLERSFNALLPCIFAHALLALNCAVVRVPSQAPFRQLFIACRFFAVLMILSGTANLTETLARNSE